MSAPTSTPTRPPAPSPRQVTGVTITVYDELSKRSGSLTGVTLCLVGAISNGFLATFGGRLLGEKVGRIQWPRPEARSREGGRFFLPPKQAAPLRWRGGRGFPPTWGGGWVAALRRGRPARAGLPCP